MIFFHYNPFYRIIILFYESRVSFNEVNGKCARENSIGVVETRPIASSGDCGACFNRKDSGD